MGKQQIWESVLEKQDMLFKTAREIWERPELSLSEKYASELQAEILKVAGMRVKHGLKDLPTAIIAEYGSGHPVIGILGEYDALSGLSQVSEPHRESLVEGGSGHGCGHNLLGTAGMGAALAIREAIDRGELKGTVRYYGCPAEEELLGKIYMLRNGDFDDCDVVLYWHPSSNNVPWRNRCLAATSVVFKFKGVPAHAPQAHLGRSALDAVELMDVGANYLREHLPKEILMHYSILGNGIAPNTVPDQCQVWYMMRAPKRSMLDPAFDRLKEVARGAAIMTGTVLEDVEVVGGGNECICNHTLGDLLYENMKECGGPQWTEEDYEFARKITELFAPGELEAGAKAFQVPDEDVHNVLQHKVLFDTGDRNASMPASGDFDMSWKMPFGGFNCATWPIGVFTHTWQATASAGSHIGMNGMMLAAKTLAGAVYDLMTDEQLMKAVKEEFAEQTKDLHYEFNISETAVPHRVM